MVPSPEINNQAPLLIAYAEGQTSYRQSIKAYLEQSGKFKVFIDVPNGKKLIESIERSGQQPDLCIFGIKMAEMNGYDTQQCLRKKWPQIKTLILSALKDDYCLQQMMNNGANGYLTKDCRLEEILQAVLTLKDQEHCYPPAYMKKVLQFLQNKEKELVSFSKKEYAFLKHCGTDLGYKQIAQIMGCSESSVNGYRDSLFRKLGISTRMGLTLFSIRTGIVNLETEFSAGF